MAYVYKAPNGKGWYCRWSFTVPNPDDPDSPKRKWQKQKFRTEAQALTKKREIEDRKASGLSIDHAAGKQTVRWWADEWHRQYARRVKPSTATKSRGLLDATVIPCLGHLPIRDVDVTVISDWLDYIEQNRTGHGGLSISPPTIRHHYLVLSNVLQFAVTKRALAFNSARDVKPPTNKARGRRPRKYVFLNPDQVAELAEALPYPYGLLIQFLAFTGLRVGEAAGLNIADVDLENAVVEVERTRTKTKGGWLVHTTKNGEPRRVPLPAALAEDLRAYLGQHPHGDHPAAPFWPGRKVVERTAGGNVSGLDYDQPWSPSVFYRRHFKPAVAVAGLPAMRMHDLRHSFASICAASNIPAAQVAEWMGHGNEVVTRTIYTHLFKEDTSRHAEALSAAFRPTRLADELADRRARRQA